MAQPFYMFSRYFSEKISNLFLRGHLNVYLRLTCIFSVPCISHGYILFVIE